MENLEKFRNVVRWVARFSRIRGLLYLYGYLSNHGNRNIRQFYDRVLVRVYRPSIF